MEVSRKFFHRLHLLVTVLAVSLRATFEHSTRGIKCLEKERQTLLIFKNQVIDEDGQLSSWGNEKDKKDCCKWEGVLCDNQTNHIIGLNLDSTSLRGPIPNAIGNLSSLRHLSLHGNQLEGGVPISLGNLSRLEYLDLSANKLTGTVPHLALSSSLIELRLEENMFSGTVTQIFRSLYKLERLSLDSNRFEDIITDSHFSNLSKLRILYMSFNKRISFNFSSAWNPPFQLTDLVLSGFKVGPHFPAWLRTQKELGVLDISNAGISDTSDWFWDWEPSPNLQFLNVSFNNFHGALPDLSSKFPSIKIIDLSFNHFSGSLPILPPVGYVDLSNNEFSGSITKICDKNNSSWTALELSNNQLSGPLPDCFANQTSLDFLVLAHNNFSGKIPALNSNILSALHLQNNSFTGEIPTSLRNCTTLGIIDLSQNKLTGKIPAWAGASWTKLVFLNLGANEFFGPIPPNLCQLAYLQVLDFSSNKISGHIPKCLNNLTAMSQVENIGASTPYGVGEIDKAYLTWKGNALSFNFKSLKQVKLIDLSSNNLVGDVPVEITGLVELIGLNLSRNNLSGIIPPKIGEIKSLNFLDLSRNHFSGNIPDGVSLLDRLGVLDLSYNNLSGRIPQSNHMLTFSDSTFEGNTGLCGLPLPRKPCTGDEIAHDPSNNTDNVEEDDKFINDGFYISMAVGFVIGFWGVWVTLACNNSWRIALFRSWDTVMDCLYVKTIISKRRVKEAFYEFVRF